MLVPSIAVITSHAPARRFGRPRVSTVATLAILLFRHIAALWPARIAPRQIGHQPQ